MEPKAFKYLVAKQETLDNNAKENEENTNKDEKESESTGDKEKETESKIGIEKKKLEQALKNARLEPQVPGKIFFFPLIFCQWPKTCMYVVVYFLINIIYIVHCYFMSIYENVMPFLHVYLYRCPFYE